MCNYARRLFICFVFFLRSLESSGAITSLGALNSSLNCCSTLCAQSVLDRKRRGEKGFPIPSSLPPPASEWWRFPRQVFALLAWSKVLAEKSVRQREGSTREEPAPLRCAKKKKKIEAGKTNKSELSPRDSANCFPSATNKRGPHSPKFMWGKSK